MANGTKYLETCLLEDRVLYAFTGGVAENAFVLDRPVTEVDMSAATLDDRKAMAKGDIGIERMREVAGAPNTYEVFGGSKQTRDRDIVRASEERGRGGWSRHRHNAVLWRVLAEFMSGVRRWHDQ